MNEAPQFSQKSTESDFAKCRKPRCRLSKKIRANNSSYQVVLSMCNRLDLHLDHPECEQSVQKRQKMGF